MHCNHARQLLNDGILPGPATPEQATLGFHISACPNCRALLRQLRVARQPEAQPASSTSAPRHPTHASAAPQRRQPAFARKLRSAGAAALVASALALGVVSFPGATYANTEAYNTVYLVKAGDTLAKIAQQVYGDAGRWQELYQANRAVIGSNPALIYPGQQLTLPALQPGKPGNETFYTVQRGDTLGSIAARFYGDAGRWQLIYEVNRATIGGNPAQIYPGQQLRIPPANPRPAPRQYTVQRGDSLVRIAEKLYGNAARWNEIYQANRAVIGANPTLIYPGQQLLIP